MKRHGRTLVDVRLEPIFTDLLPRSECLETGNQYKGIRTPT